MPQPFRVRTDFAELSDFDIDPASVRLLPRLFCRRNGIAILSRVDPNKTEPVVIGAVRPEASDVLAQVSEELRRPLDVVRLNLYEIDRVLRTSYDDTSPLLGHDEARRIALRHPPAGADATAAEIVDSILAEAVRIKASDIHVETYFEDVDLRYRVDGILHQQFTQISPSNAAEVVSRVKILSSLDIAERRRPQDGRFRCVFTDAGRFLPVDFRVSVVPSPAGEDVVIRVLDASAGLLTIRQLGMAASTEDEFSRLLANPEGLLLMTGPTSSGKTTTLYSALAHMSNQQRKIITAEDPIEYYIDRINQKQVSPNMSMNVLLRAMLRQNPDVILIGEIRDLESGDIALEAAATGHLVLGTVHTADAIGTVMRLRGIGLDNADISANLLGAIGQRLVRRICPSCAMPTDPTEAQKSLYGSMLDGRTFKAGAGCSACYNTGYKGRIGLYELLLVGEELQDMISDGAARHDLRRFTASRGFRNMTLDAMDKASQGLTTLDELTRVLPYRQIVLTLQDHERGLGQQS